MGHIPPQGTHSPTRDTLPFEKLHTPAIQTQREQDKNPQKIYRKPPERAKGVASGPAPGHVVAGIGSKIVGGESDSYGI